MTDRYLERVFDRAYAALKDMPGKSIRNLSLIDCAVMLTVLPSHSQLDNLRSRLAKRLQEQLNPAWIRDGDLFEVFLVFTAIWQYDQTSIVADYLVCAVQRLIRSEVVAGGPYRSHGTIEFAANLQIAQFARLVAKPLPGIDAFLKNVIAAGHHKATLTSSPYLLYLASSTSSQSEIVSYLKECKAMSCGHRAVALATLKPRLFMTEQELQAICNKQHQAGWWKPEHFAGGDTSSHIVMTAFVVSMLDIYKQRLPSPRMLALRQKQQAIAEVAKRQFTARAEPLRSSALAAVDKICRADVNFEVTLLPYFFSQAVKDSLHFDSQQYTLLGAANVCSWIAYTIYDDFLDGEGVPAQLPVANVAMHASLDCFKATIPKQEKFQRYIIKVFAEMDEANAWEVHYCRFVVKENVVTVKQLPSYGKGGVLAARSFAHALGPIAVLSQNNFHPSKNLHSIESAFRHYLIARQLCDDIHDWQDDLQAGLASYVVTAILRDMRLQPGTYNVPFLLAAMQKQFRHTTFTRVSLLALSHINKARQDFRKYESWQSSSGIDTLLDNLESSLIYSLDQHEKAAALIKI